MGRPPPWPRSSCRPEPAGGPRLPGLLARRSRPPSRTLAARLVGRGPDLGELRLLLLLLLRATSQMEAIPTLPTKSSSDIEWTWVESGLQPEPGILQLWTDSDSWSEAVLVLRESAREGLTPTHPCLDPPIPSAAMCAASTPFDQLSPSLTTLPIPPFRRLTDSPVTGPVSPQVTNYDFRLNLDAFSNEETAVGGGRSYKSSTLHSWMTCSANIHRHHQCHHHHHCHRHRQQHFTFGWHELTLMVFHHHHHHHLHEKYPFSEDYAVKGGDLSARRAFTNGFISS